MLWCSALSSPCQHPIAVLVWVPAAPILRQLPVNAPWKAAAGGPDTRVPAPTWETWVEFQGPALTLLSPGHCSYWGNVPTEGRHSFSIFLCFSSFWKTKTSLNKNIFKELKRQNFQPRFWLPFKTIKSCLHALSSLVFFVFLWTHRFLKRASYSLSSLSFLLLFYPSLSPWEPLQGICAFFEMFLFIFL